MPSDSTFSQPILKAITIRLVAEADQQSPQECQDLVLRALAGALIAVDDSPSLAWTVQAGCKPLQYNLTPLPGHPVSAEEARSMIDALRSQPQIAAAEPTFVGAGDAAQPPLAGEHGSDAARS